MIDLDKYLDQTIEFKIKGEVIKVKQPTAFATKKIAQLEKKITDENYLDTRCEITGIILNSNVEGKIFTVEEIEALPFKVQEIISVQIATMKFEADNDPN